MSVRAFHKLAVVLLLSIAGLFFSRAALAHKPSDAYLFMTVEGSTVHARWDIALRDLSDAQGVDSDENGEVTWAEARAAYPNVAASSFAELRVLSNGAECTRSSETNPAVAQHTDGAYLVLRADYVCPALPTILGVRYGLFFARDPQHRGIVRVDSATATHSFVLSKDDREKSVTLDDPGALRRAFFAMVRAGLSHIAEGYDHLLFLFALLFPAVLVRKEETWEPAPTFKKVLFDVLRVVTAFTVAHSLTLSLAVLGVVRLPSRLVESVIAASVVVAAANNLKPVFKEGRFAVAFVLGLMHGFGFSATLEDLELSRGALVVSLLGFNVGVELGQLAVVLVFLPIAYRLRATRFYRRGVLIFGSAAIVAIALVWLAERAFVVKLLPG